MSGAAISAVNWSEVADKYTSSGVSQEAARELLDSYALETHAFTKQDAETTARLKPSTAPAGLSLADRACLALALRLGRTVATADRPWATISVGVTIMLVR